VTSASCVQLGQMRNDVVPVLSDQVDESDVRGGNLWEIVARERAARVFPFLISSRHFYTSARKSWTESRPQKQIKHASLAPDSHPRTMMKGGPFKLPSKEEAEAEKRKRVRSATPRALLGPQGASGNNTQM